jgi:hypothetical protein
VLAVSAAVVLLMLGVASLVAALRDDPGSVGKRYDLTARLPADRAADVRALPGVADAAPRYVAEGADSFALGEPVKLVAFPGDHTRFEDPPLDTGAGYVAATRRRSASASRRRWASGSARPWLVQLPGGGEARFRVVGTVRALDDSGRVGLRAPRAAAGADPGCQPPDRGQLAPGRRPRGRRAAAGDAGRPARGGRAAPPRATAPSWARWRAAARGGDRRRARVPLRAGPGARASWPASARRRSPCCARPAPRAPPSAAVWPERRSRSPCPRRRPRLGARAPRARPAQSGTWRPATPDLEPQSSAGQAALALGGLALLGIVAAAWVARRAIAAPPLQGLREE